MSWVFVGLGLLSLVEGSVLVFWDRRSMSFSKQGGYSKIDNTGTEKLSARFDGSYL